MIARLSSLMVWGLVAVAAVAWGLRVSGRMTPVPAHASLASPPVQAAGDFSRVLGTPPPAPVAAAPEAVTDARFKLLGVVAPRQGQGEGLALISIDGKPGRATKLGRELEPGLRVLSISQRKVELGGAGQAKVTLELPALAEAQRGRPGDPIAAPGSLSAGGPAAMNAPNRSNAPRATGGMPNGGMGMLGNGPAIDPATGQPIPAVPMNRLTGLSAQPGVVLNQAQAAEQLGQPQPVEGTGPQTR